jgi:hypothetical protein
MNQWDMAATRNQIKRLYGHQQLEMAAPALRSVIDRRDYAHYHYHEANNLFRSFAEKRKRSINCVIPPADELV